MSDPTKKTRKPAAARQDTSITFRLNPLLVEQLDALVPSFERRPDALAGATANRSAVARACLTYGVSHYLRKLREEPPAAKVTPQPETPAAPPTPSKPPTLPETMLRHKTTAAALAAADSAGDLAARHRLAELLATIEAEEMPLAEELDGLRLAIATAERDGQPTEELRAKLGPLKPRLAKLRQVTP